MTIIIFILILSILILVHELGHFLMAKKQGIKVEEFGFGLPPRLFGLKIGETIYSLNLIPLGGFTKLYGEEYYEIKTHQQSDRAFINKKPWQKALVVIGGVLGNFLLGWFLLSFLVTQGVPVPTNKVIIDKVVKNSPADLAGIKEKDVVLKFNSLSLTSPTSLISLTQKYVGQPITLIIQRDDQIFPMTIIPRKNPPTGEGPLGIAITSYLEKKYPWYQTPFFGLYEAVRITYQIASELLRIIFQLITFQHPQVDVSGPLGIASYTSSAIKFGKNAVLELLALLSFNLAIINILPFPALDGGRMIFVLYEAVAKKRPNKNIEKYTNFIGMIILLSLGILITIHDIIKIIR